MSIERIEEPLAGERVVALSPEDANLAATDWLRRPNLFAGRALTAPTLEGRQNWQAGRIAQRGQAFTPGVVRGLEVLWLAPGADRPADEVRVLVEPGQGLAVSGEDVMLARRAEFLLQDLPVAAPPAWFKPLGEGELPADEPPMPGTLHPRVTEDEDGNYRTLADMRVSAGARMSRVGVLVLQPVTVDRSDFNPNDPCDRCACEDGGSESNVSSFEDWRIADGARLVWYPWPEEWKPLPYTTLRLRNALAHSIFESEAALPHGEALPWEGFGLPIALIGVDENWNPEWVDRAAVVRQGGRAREARLQLAAGGGMRLAANSRLPALWQARIEQFAEQMAESGEPLPAPDVLADPYLRLPPCGLIPKSALDLEKFRSPFFPPIFELDAVPVPMEQLDLAMREAAPLAPFDISAPERLRLLVPVTQASWEPRLLHTEVIDPEFQQTLNRFLSTRSRMLGARQGLRSKAALLAHAVDGKLHEVIPFDKDPLALEPELLSPWGLPPSDGGHRSALMSGVHQHYFDSAQGFAINAGDILYAWVYLDPDNPPRTLMLQWHDKAGWEHRAYLGEDLIAWGSPDTAGHQWIGKLPTLGEWVRVTVDAEKVGLAKGEIDGMSFALFDGRAAYGQTGVLREKQVIKWFSNSLPLGARAQGNESWDLLTHNDLWAPFELDDGVVPSLPEAQVIGGGGDIFDAPAEATARLPLPVSGFNVMYPTARGWRGHSVIMSDFASAPIIAKNGSDKVTVWVYLDELTPPRAVWAGLACLGTEGNSPSGGSASQFAFWGENRLAELYKVSPAFASYDNKTTRAGALPQSGVWTELEIPLPNLSEINSSTVRVFGIIFMAFDGTLAFSDISIRRSATPDTPELVWPKTFKDGLPVPKYNPFLNAKLEPQNDAEVLSPTPSSRIGTVRVYTELMSDPQIRLLSNHEQSQVLLRGVKGFADYLRTRIDRADDITDFGFAHMQVDMHRVRQMMMSTADASRLAISPALAAIAKSDSALNVQSQIRDYLSSVKTTATAKATVAAPAATPRATVAGSLAGTSFTAAQTVQMSTMTSRLIKKPAAPASIIYAMPVLGLSEVRTTAIADRLKQPPSTEARDHALANRHRAVASIANLLTQFMTEDSGEVPALFANFEVLGLAGDPFLVPGVNPPRRKLIDFHNDPALIEKLLQPPPLVGGVDEASLFTQTVALSDNTIAMLRALEGKLSIYRNALTRADLALADLTGSAAAVAARLAEVADALAEARHDVGVARALIAEEEARIAAINTRRQKVLSEEVQFLAFARPRETSNVAAVPRRVIDPALQEAPVPACLRDHHDVPDELEDMLKVVREAPAAWFVAAPKIINQLDRVDLLMRTLKGAQARTYSLAARTPVASVAAGKLGSALANVVARQGQHVSSRIAAVSRLNLDALAVNSWKSVRDQVQEVVSMGDLIDGEHGKTLIARMAADEFNKMGAICTCLHAEFCGVSASIRLDWAELLSEFDEAPNLRNLGSLPRWSEVDSIDRRQMQSYVDWLFATTEPKQPKAEALINDVVRMCLLLASHAPVGRIVAGNMPRPVTGVRPGVRIPLHTLDLSKLRIGMQAVLYRANTVIARAQVEDIGNGEASARVLHTNAATVDLDLDVRVHFDHANVVSASPKRTGGIFKR